MSRAQPRTPTEEYRYADLAQVCQRGIAHGSSNYRRPQLHCYAVVAECTQPRITKGTDWACNLVLVDPSLGPDHESRDGIEMVCFAREPTCLPRARHPGDVIRMHRVEAQAFNGRPQLQGKVPVPGDMYRSHFSYALFDGAAGGSERPYQTSHDAWPEPHYSWDEREAGLLAAVRAFVAQRGRSHLTGGGEWLRRIKDVRPNAFFDVVGLVVAAEYEDPALRVLWLWDNSDAVPLTLGADTRDSEDVREDGSELAELRARLAPLPLPLADMGRELAAVPKLGTALPVVLQVPGAVSQAWPAEGSWVKFRNLGCRAVQGQLQAYYHSRSKWMPWEEDGDVMREHVQRVAANAVAGWAPSRREELLAACAHAEQPYATLRQVLMDTPLREPRYYKVLARVMDYSPHDPGEMTHHSAECGLAPGYPHTRAYTLQLLLEDATAQLDACLFGPGADAFFGAPAADLERDAEARAALLAKLEQLLGAGCLRSGGPWVELCLKSHYTDPEQPWDSRQYLIEDSSLQEAAPPLPLGQA